MAVSIPGVVDLQVIGRGGFSTVYRGHETAFDRDVAVKVLVLHVASDAERSRFERECRAHGSLANHPNVVTLHGAGLTADDVPYLILPYLPGGSLADRIAGGARPLQEVLTVGTQIAGALDYAHQRGVVHRDVKPANVLFDEFDTPLLADFGISQMQGAFETRSGQMSASVAYAAPEVFAGESATAAGDVYSLAATLHAALTGRPAFYREGDDNMLALMIRVAHDPVPDLVAAGVPAPVAEVLEQGMAKAPGERFASAAAFARALQDAGEACGIAVAAPRLSAVPADPPTFRAAVPETDEQAADGSDVTQIATPAPGGSSRSRRTFIAVAAVVAVLLVVIGLLVTRSDRDEIVQPPETHTSGTDEVEPTTEDLLVTDAPVELVPGVGLLRSTTVAAPDGDSVEMALTFSNDLDDPARVVHLEVVPKDLAETVDDLTRSLPAGASEEVVEADPVLRFTVELPPGDEVTVKYSADVEAGPLDEDRVGDWAQARGEAEFAYLLANPTLTALTTVTVDGPEGPVSVLVTPTAPQTNTTGTTDGGSGGGGTTPTDGGGSVATPSSGGSGSSPTVTEPAPVFPPGAPIGVEVRDPSPVLAGDCTVLPSATDVTVAWTAPSDDGGASISRYWILAELVGGSGVIRSIPFEASGSARSKVVRVPRDDNDAYWTYTVRAENSAGAGGATRAVGRLPDMTGTVYWGLYTVIRAVSGHVAEVGDTSGSCPVVVAQSAPAGTVINPGVRFTFTIESN